MNKDDFLKKLLATFRVEAKEHIASMSAGLIGLEKTSVPEEQMKIIETIFREAHSLKGAARSVNMTEIEAVCQSLENVFAELKRQNIILSQGLFDILHRAVDAIGKLIFSVEAEGAASEKPRIKDLIRQLEDAAKKAEVREKGTDEEAELREQKTGEEKTMSPVAMMTETIRISASKLNSIMLQAEELLSAKLSTTQRAVEIQEINSYLSAWKKEWTKAASELKSKISGYREKNSNEKNNNPKNDFVNMQLNEFFRQNENHITALVSRLDALKKSALHDQHSISLMTGNLLEDMKNVLMLPFSSLLEIFPKLVRDLSHAQGKEVELVIHGSDIEIDRRILEEVKDPLIHLVRNCIDHGIEKTEERKLRGKGLPGRIIISILQADSKKVEILVSDDGAGIDLEKVKVSALRLGLLSSPEADNLDIQKILPFIFQSGVTTSPIITDISGRGLGLAIVQEKIGKLGGIISCETKPQEGTTFRMTLPLSLSTYRGVLVRVDEHLFVIPTINMQRMKRTKKDEIKTVENRETVLVDGQAIPFIPLYAALELPQKVKKAEDEKLIQTVVLNSAEKLFAFSVDEVLNEQDVLVKGLGRQLSRTRNIAGATVLGTGRVVPILNIPDLIKSAVKLSASPVRISAVPEESLSERKSILVVEDSITARTLLKNILETAGYDVKTAVDGIEAFTLLKTEYFDMVVSDIDMPRMNGFDLTAKIRADKKLAEMPVVLVTALDSREDRERGIDAGANAYIVKSSFDQSNLLEVIRRLI